MACSAYFDVPPLILTGVECIINNLHAGCQYRGSSSRRIYRLFRSGAPKLYTRTRVPGDPSYIATDELVVQS